MNTPFRKGDELPHINEFPNRRQRRGQARSTAPFNFGTSKNRSLITTPTSRGTVGYFRTVQRIGDKTIFHYILKTIKK